MSVISADNPWGDLSMLERYPTYVPALMDTYLRRTKYARFVNVQIDFGAMRSRQMVLTRQIHGRPNFSPKTAKTLEFQVQTFMGLQRKTIDIEYHFDKIQWHDDDQLFNFTNVPLPTLCRNELGWNMSQYFDYLARRATLGSAYAYYINGTDFSGLTSSSHIFDLTKVNDILLSMEYEDMFDGEDAMPTVACLTSPGVISDIANAAPGEWRSLNAYTEEGRRALMAYGIKGVYKGVGFIPSTIQVLWCAGPVSVQIEIVEPMNTLDGVANSANAQGWNSAQSGIKNYIQLSSTPATGALSSIAAGDVIVIHRTRTDAYGVTSGVDPNEGTADHRVVASVDTGNNRIVLTEPWLKDGYTAPLEGVLGWVTKANHIHMSSFIADASALQMGVAQAPLLNQKDGDDDMGKLHKLAWDFHGAISLMNHQGIRNVFSRASFTAAGYPGAVSI